MLAAFWTWDRNLQSSSISSRILHDDEHPCFKLLHNGKPLSSHGYRRPFDETFHGKPFFIHTPKRGLYSYKPAQISSSLIKYTEELRNPNPRLKRTMRQFNLQHHGLREWRRLESRKYEHWGAEELLCDYGKCFDNLFFGGALKRFYKISFVEPALTPDAIGLCSSGCSFEHGFEIDIKITNTQPSGSLQSLNKQSQRRDYLGVLLHEMVHAVFQLYCCRTCTPCEDKHSNEVGASGHSMSWQRLAKSIENVLNQLPVFIGAETWDLARSISFCLEYNGDSNCDANVNLQDSLTIRQLEGLKLDSWAFSDIRDQIQIRRKKRAAARRREAKARKEREPKKTVLGGRVSKPNRPRSRH